ncbi:MAG: MotA/TolQ/ExbB proton channel family protein [Lentisphaerae bacterium]|nr:MotA/TolQ/ExbB proton channel family protein [Lentisphaerota bacterium]
MKNRFSLLWCTLAFVGLMGVRTLAQDAAAPAAADAAAEPAAGQLVAADGQSPPPANKDTGGFWAVVFGSGWLGVALWFALFAAGGIAVYLAVDSCITVRVKRIMPDALVKNVTAAMAEGDVLKALKNCEDEPGPLANILQAGFGHVEEGFDVIQEAVTTAADLETERMMQKLTWMSVVANLSTMLGLLGTVQGMIVAFASLATGAPDIGVLALAISQALYTTAAGLTIAVPCIATFYALRNNANTIILRMEALTMELIKDLRNVEVVEE